MSAVTTNDQLALCLSDRSADEILTERLETSVAEFNEHSCTPERRVELIVEIRRLRALLSGKGGQ